MNLLERVVEVRKQRLKEWDENPDPALLKCTRMRLELEIEGCEELLESWQQGKPILPHFPSVTLARALGSRCVLYEALFSAHLEQFEERMPTYIEAARNLGMPEYMCDIFCLPNAASMLGELPPPIVGGVQPAGWCHVWLYHLKGIYEHYGMPQFEMDTPSAYDEESVKYMADQLGDLIEWVEKKVPGLKYDEDKHRELIEANRVYVNYCLREFELKKNVPLPMDSRDATSMTLDLEPNLYGDPYRALDYWRQRTEEIEERVAKKEGKEEKLRLMGSVRSVPPPLLESRGAVIAGSTMPATRIFVGRWPNWGDEEFGRKLTPLEEEARYLLGDRGGIQWVEDAVWICKELGCDAIVFGQPVGCSHIGGPAKLIADKAEKELGVPSLLIQGRLSKPGFALEQSPAELEAIITQFLDAVLARKGQ
ncbi:MAG: 2-hydroxyacyl-CoA dehydratase family protein [Dehalococcoidia bacterium]|jgi:hypothetical protein